MTVNPCQVQSLRVLFRRGYLSLQPHRAPDVAAAVYGHMPVLVTHLLTLLFYTRYQVLMIEMPAGHQ